jgi:CRP-like cAMP-binding protein
MKKNIRKNNRGLRFLLQYWQRYCTLEDWHTDWAKRHIHVLSKRKGDILYYDGEKQKRVYLVAKGLLARVRYDDSGKRQILSVALPGMALMTTEHLYSDTPSVGDIIVLRPDTLIIQIPYNAVLAFKEQEPQLNTLIAVLTNKNKKQMSALSRIMHEREPFRRYLLFANDMSQIHRNLTHTETAEILGISLSSSQRYYKRWLES